MAPSIKTLSAHWPDKAKILRGIMTGNVDPESFESVKDWTRQCYNRPSDVELRLAAINDALDGYGVEALDRDPGWFPYPEYSYVNMGDTYTTTILHQHTTGRWIVSDWGSIAERWL